MGYHFINGSLLDATVDPLKPEALVYAPDRHGKLHLVALEYVDVPGTLDGRPRIGDADAVRPDVHVDRRAEPVSDPGVLLAPLWLWQDNPSGLFAPFNPAVSCDPGSGHHGKGGDASQAGARTAATRFDCDVDKKATATRT